MRACAVSVMRPCASLRVATYIDAWMPCIFPVLRGPVVAPTIDLTIHFRADLPLPHVRPED